MQKFMIKFSYNDQEFTATVTKSSVGDRIDYAVRPTSPLIISRFGGEIMIFRENNNFAVNTSKDDSYKDFIDVLSNAIRLQDKEGAAGKTKRHR